MAPPMHHGAGLEQLADMLAKREKMPDGQIYIYLGVGVALFIVMSILALCYYEQIRNWFKNRKREREQKQREEALRNLNLVPVSSRPPVLPNPTGPGKRPSTPLSSFIRARAMNHLNTPTTGNTPSTPRPTTPNTANTPTATNTPSAAPAEIPPGEARRSSRTKDWLSGAGPSKVPEPRNRAPEETDMGIRSGPPKAPTPIRDVFDTTPDRSPSFLGAIRSKSRTEEDRHSNAADDRHSKAESSSRFKSKSKGKSKSKDKKSRKNSQANLAFEIKAPEYLNAG